MEKKIWTFVNWGILFIVAAITVWVVLGGSSENNDGTSGGIGGLEDMMNSCVDVKELDGFEYDACYDATSEMIFLKVSRDETEFNVVAMDVSYVDLSSQFYSLDEVPGDGESKAYKFPANKNPKKLDLRLDVIYTSGIVCGSSQVFIDYCPVGTSGGGVDVSISPIDGVGISDFVEVEDIPDSGMDADIVTMDLVEKEAIWESTCSSSWDCGDWESCVDGVQRRVCEDVKNCLIPTNSPITVQFCDGTCVENWECEWKDCEDGFSVPDCRDLNDCGTSYDKPDKIRCSSEKNCVPEIVCGEWSECEVDYDFDDLVSREGVSELTGSKFRLCEDEAGCASAQKDEAECSIGVDIYTRRISKCGEEYVEVYNALDDSALAVLKKGGGKSPYLDIHFDDETGVYCDYCFDGEMDGDETGVDCGGSCPACEDNIVVDRNWWDFFILRRF